MALDFATQEQISVFFCIQLGTHQKGQMKQHGIKALTLQSLEHGKQEIGLCILKLILTEQGSQKCTQSLGSLPFEQEDWKYTQIFSSLPFIKSKNRGPVHQKKKKAARNRTWVKGFWLEIFGGCREGQGGGGQGQNRMRQWARTQLSKFSQASPDHLRSTINISKLTLFRLQFTFYNLGLILTRTQDNLLGIFPGVLFGFCTDNQEEKNLFNIEKQPTNLFQLLTLT